MGTNASGMRGLWLTELPLAPPELNVAATAGYGVTEPYHPVPGVHQRLQGSVGGAFSPLPWLAFALRLDGRVEFHPNDYDGAHSAGFGDPRLFARAGYALSPDLSVGFELGLWLPGNQAPSYVPSATTLDSRALLAFTPRDSPWSLLGALGFRWDNSANSAPDLTRLRLGDRISLGLSDSNAVLVALGVGRKLGDRYEVFGELSGDVLVGQKAPPFVKSPLRAAVGARYALNDALQLDLTTLTSLSRRPSVRDGQPLVPMEPRFTAIVGARYRFDFGAPARAAHAPELEQRPERSAAPPPPTAAVAAPKPVALRGSLVDDHGQPLPEVTVQLQTAGAEPRETITDAQGRYEFSAVPVGPASLEATAVGFATQRWDVSVGSGPDPLPPRALTPQSGNGVLRGLIRSFDSQPLRAQIAVQAVHGRFNKERSSGADGRFEIELAPGSYRVTISAPGYRIHSRSVKIEPNAVSILNVDMRQAK